MNRLSLSIFLLFALALGLYVAVWLAPNDRLETAIDTPLMTPDYIATDITTYVYDSAGRLAHEVYAAQAEHYAELDTVLFKRPSYSIYPEEGGPWLMNAEEGSLSGDNMIQLERTVVVTTPSVQEFVQRITTEFLAFDLTERIALSDKMVTIEGMDYVIQSRGLRANLNNRQFELKHHVQTRYFPSR